MHSKINNIYIKKVIERIPEIAAEAAVVAAVVLDIFVVGVDIRDGDRGNFVGVGHKGDAVQKAEVARKVVLHPAEKKKKILLVTVTRLQRGGDFFLWLFTINS